MILMKDEYYFHKDGLLIFQYYPESGRVVCYNGNSYPRAIEHFCLQGFHIDWLKCVQHMHILYVKVPEDKSVEESNELLGKSTDELVATSKIEKEKEDATIKAQNVNNETGDVLRWETINQYFANMGNDRDYNTAKVVRFIDHYNLEDIRPDNPVMKASTKSKKVVIAEGKKWLKRLHDKGQLRKLTEEEFNAKMLKHNPPDPYLAMMLDKVEL